MLKIDLREKRVTGFEFCDPISRFVLLWQNRKSLFQDLHYTPRRKVESRIYFHKDRVNYNS